MKKSSVYRVGLVILLLLFITGIVACGNSNVSNGNKKKAEITEDYVALTEIKEGQPDIYVVVKNMASSYWKVVLDGTKQAGIDLNCNIYAAGSSLETEWELQEAYVDRAIENGADGIILAPDNSVKLASAVERARANRIPIIVVDTIVNSDKYDVCYMTDNLYAGEQAAKVMMKQLGAMGYNQIDKVNVAIELGAINSQTINERLAGFCNYWTRYAPIAWNIIEEIKCNDGDEELAVKLSKDFFKENPDITGVFGTDNASTMGFATALSEQENRDVAMVGFDYSAEVADIINDGRYQVSVLLQRQYSMGYNGVQSICDIKAGKKVEMKFVDTGLAVLNKETLGSEEILEILQVNNYRGK